jgi:membrane-bound inhibitor of C-type lysozyme
MIGQRDRLPLGTALVAAVVASCWLGTKVASVPQVERGSGPAVVQPPGISAPGASKARIQQNYAKLPLSFEANAGQTDGSVQFLARGPGYGLYLTSTEAVMVLNQRSTVRNQASGGRPGPASGDRFPAVNAPPTVLHMQLLGGNPAVQVMGRDELPGQIHYFLGNDPAKWRTNVATFARVEYANVYPGIDLVYYGNPEQLEYDFVVAPGADPQAVHLAFTGADQVRFDEHGDLVLHAGDQKIHWRKPVAYQEVNGSRQEIAAAFVLLDEASGVVSAPRELPSLTQPGSLAVTPPTLSGPAHQVGFLVASYDTNRPLVIDPVLSYSTFLGGSGGDEGRGIAVDPKSGDALITGSTNSTDFPAGNPLQPNSSGDFDVFVTRLSADGSTLLFSTYLGGSGADYSNGIALDPTTGHALVTGATLSPDFPTVKPMQANNGGNYDAFVARLSADGSTLIFSTYLGGSGADFSNGIAVDPTTGHALIAGATLSTDFPTANPLQLNKNGDYDAFVARLNADGSGLVFSTYLGGSGADYGNAISVDPTTGHALITGATSSANFPTVNSLQAHNAGDADVFVARLSADGKALIFSTYLGGGGADYGNAISVDPTTGHALVTGATASTNFPTAKALQPDNAGGNDAFVARLSADGSTLVFSTLLGGSGGDFGNGITVDPATGHALVTGQTNSTDFPTANALQPDNAGGNDAFVARLSADGSVLVFSTYLGGSFVDYGRGIAVDPTTGAALITGLTNSPDFPSVNPFQSSNGGGNDAFMARISF